MSSQTVRPAPAAAALTATARGLPTAVPACACLAVALGALLAAEVGIGEVLLFAGFQIAFALVPGLICQSLLAGRARSAIDALVLALPAGMAIQIGCFVLTAALGARALFAFYPIAFVLAGALLLVRRRELWPPWRTPGGERAPRRAARSSALAALLVSAIATAVVYAALFAQSPLPRAARSVSYYPDLVFNVSLASEILHHWPFTSPSVAGVGLHYHIFVNVQMAAAAQVTGIELASIALRLVPALLVATIGLQLFALGRRLAHSSAAGFVAVVLGLFAGELNFSHQVLAGGGLPALGFLLSPSYLLGAVFFLALVGVLAAGPSRPTRGSPAQPVGSPDARGRSRARHAALLGLLGFGAVGAKSSVVPVLLGGLALFALGLLPRPRADRRAARTAAVGLAVLGAIAAGGYLLLYRGGGEAVRLKPLDFLSYSGFASVYHRAGHSPAYALAACLAAIVVLCALLLPLAGALLVRERWLPRHAAGTPERLLLCMLAASLAPFVLLAVPGDSEAYFVVYGFLAGVLVSAAGVTRALSALARKPSRLARPALGASFVVVLACLTVASELVEQTAPTIRHVLRGQPSFEASGTDAHRGLTAAELRGLTWIREHTPASAVLAVNNHGLGGDGGSRYVYYSAFAERRVFLESWQYTPQGAEFVARKSAASPFPRLLALNEAAVARASPTAIALLHSRYGVDYVVIDRLHGPLSPGLHRLALRVYANPAVEVFGIA